VHSQLVQLASDRRREMLAEARQQRPLWLELAYRRATRRADRAERRMRRAYRAAAHLRAGL
jgi:cell division septum initiation protein DivIVA